DSRRWQTDGMSDRFDNHVPRKLGQFALRSPRARWIALACLALVVGAWVATVLRRHPQRMAVFQVIENLERQFMWPRIGRDLYALRHASTADEERQAFDAIWSDAKFLSFIPYDSAGVRLYSSDDDWYSKVARVDLQV